METFIIDPRFAGKRTKMLSYLIEAIDKNESILFVKQGENYHIMPESKLEEIKKQASYDAVLEYSHNLMKMIEVELYSTAAKTIQKNAEAYRSGNKSSAMAQL